MTSRFLTKDQMVDKLRSLQNEGWLSSLRPGNTGGIGNTIDHMLGLTENNLPIADTAQWELKSHRLGSASLITFFHMEPHPRKAKIVPTMLLPFYGWAHQQAGIKYPSNERSFRQTLRATHRTDRGFKIVMDDALERVAVSFDSSTVDSRHSNWLASVNSKVGLGELDPQPYWTYQDVLLKASTKMLNAFYVETETRKEGSKEFFRIAEVMVLQNFNHEKFISAIKDGNVLVDFDARSGHNHGVKYRIKENVIPKLYLYSEKVLVHSSLLRPLKDS